MRRTLRILLLSMTWASFNVAALWAASDPITEGRRDLDEGHFQNAIQAVSEILGRRPEHREALQIRALAESGLGRFNDAVADYELILEKHPEDAETHRDLGVTLAFKKKDAKRALTHLDRYLSLTKGGLDSLEAMRTAKLMQILDASHTPVERRAIKELLEMAQSFERAGNERVAIQTYERILQISPTDEASHEALGRLMEKKRRNAEEGEMHLSKARLFRMNG